MKKTGIVIAAVAAFFAVTGLSLPATHAEPQIVVTPNPCLPGFKYTVEVKIHVYGYPWTVIDQSIQGFHSQDDITAFFMAYNTGNYSTHMSVHVLCVKEVGGPHP